MHVARAAARTRARGDGVDNFDPYYDVALKEARLATARRHVRDSGSSASISPTRRAAARLFRDGGFTHVVHLAAQPGVRYSLVNPDAYLANNLTAFGHVIEGCRHARVAHLVYASSSSVYGANHTLPFSEDQNVDHPVSLYAATKKANELMAHSYSHLFALPTTGTALLHRLRAVGPARHGADAVHEGDPRRRADPRVQRRQDAARFHLRRRHRRRRRARARAPAGADGDGAPYAIYNIGNHEAVELETFIATLERLLGRAGDQGIRADAAGRRAGDLRVDRPAGRGRPDSRRARRSPTASRASSRGIATTITRRRSDPRGRE